MTNVQDFSAVLTWRHDWTARLTRAENDLGLAEGFLTITNASATGPAGTTVSPVTHDTTTVTFTLATTGITVPTTVRVTVHVTLSNGDQDEVDVPIVVTNT